MTLAKGKVERFFRTLREQFLVRNLDLSSLESLNRQFHEWVEGEYNSRRHGTLGMSPIDRFNIDSRLVTWLPSSEATEELFYIEKEIPVHKDNTFRFDSRRWETPVELAGKKITIRYNRAKKDRVVVYLRDQRMGEAREVDLVANGRLRRSKNTREVGK